MSGVFEPGVYNDECTQARHSTKAVAVLLLVIEGDRGNGVSLQCVDPDLMPVLPTMLEAIAHDMRQSAKRKAN